MRTWAVLGWIAAFCLLLEVLIEAFVLLIGLYLEGRMTVEAIAVWLGANWLWIVGPIVALGAFGLLWGACWRAGDIDQAYEDAGLGRRS